MDVEASGIPKEHIQTIFYRPDSFDGLKLSPNKTYWVTLDLRANYYSFLFKRNYGFAIYTWQELNDGEAGPAIELYPGWKNKYTLYAVATWLQIGLLFPALFFVWDALNGSKDVKKFAAWLIAIFTSATLWVIRVDQPFFNQLSDYVLPGFALALSLGLIIVSFISFQRPDVDDEDEIA